MRVSRTGILMGSFVFAESWSVTTEDRLLIKMKGGVLTKAKGISSSSLRTSVKLRFDVYVLDDAQPAAVVW